MTSIPPRMSHDEAVKAMAKMREFLASTKAEEFVTSMNDFMKKQSSSFHEAISGASFDAIGTAADMLNWADGKKPRNMGFGADPSFSEILSAALFRCIRRSCRHARGAKPTSLIALIGPEILTCRDCILSFAQQLADYDEHKPEPDRCDYCLRRGVTTFRALSSQLGPVAFFGDCCDECDKLVKVGQSNRSP